MANLTTQPVSAVQEWRARMGAARDELPEGIGQQDVLNWISRTNPLLDRLTNATRWRNAWLGRVADPEFTQLVESYAKHLKTQMLSPAKRLRRQKLKKV